MPNDFREDPQPENPFASPPSTFEPRLEPVRIDGGVVCNGTCTDALRKGWELMIRHFWPFAGFMIFCYILRIPGDYGEDIARLVGGEYALAVYTLSLFYDVLIATPISMGLSWVFLKAARSEHFSLGDIFGAFARNYPHAVLAGILQVILILVGLALLILPGIYLILKLSFVDYLVVDRRMGAIQAIKESWRMTEAREGTLLCLLAMSMLIFLGGLLLLVVGVIPAMNWLCAAYAVLYYTYCRKERPIMSESKPDSDNPFGY